MKTKHFLVFSFLIAGEVFAQQDKHLSMWNENPSSLNAGAVGVMDEDIRLLANYRMQWLTLEGQPFTTANFSFDTKVKLKNSFNTVGFGVNFSNDQTGDARIVSNVVSVPIAFSLALDRQNFVSVGMSPGFYMQSLTQGAQTWDTQWDGSGFDQGIDNQEFEYYPYSTSSFDLGAGIHYKYIADENGYVKAGISMNHLNSPNLTYFGSNGALFKTVNIMVSGSKFYPMRKVAISPQALLSFMGPNHYYLIGSYVEHELFESSERTDYVQRSFFSYGLFMRWNDAVIASISYKRGGFKIGVSYDVNYSSLRAFTKTVGAAEVFLKYSMIADKRGTIHDRKFFRWKGTGTL